jgi:hypothetical protein
MTCMAFGRIGMGISMAEPDEDEEEADKEEEDEDATLEPNGVDDDAMPAVGEVDEEEDEEEEEEEEEEDDGILTDKEPPFAPAIGDASICI